MTNKHELGAIILRIVLGITFFIHGLDKFQTGIDQVSTWFDGMGIAGFFAYVVALVEVIGGAALILGLGTRIAGSLLCIIMIVAIFKVKLDVGFTGNGSMAGYELDLALLAMALYLAINGSKQWSLDGWFSSLKESKVNNPS
ncbi:DoxX family protein [Cytobacillus sp. Hm23]|uniref:DoxX family protein n=1 Tax=Cytobacillus sp. IB215665 TaxID=3097357 RepID=UPI002A0D9A27|nr:DoxX family protein [Cytobacillus sp. IB215665]MDX8364555.1 DoxX family protein [Cytobacillus sp. IB215665]